MARTYLPGTPFVVTIQVRPNAGVMAYAVEDQPPSEWPVGVISESGTFDPSSGKVKWGPFLDGVSRTLTYQITPKIDVVDGVFTGIASFDGVELVVEGVRRTISVRRLNLSFSNSVSGWTNGLVFQMSGPRDTTVVVENSADVVLGPWSPILTNTLTGQTLEFRDRG